MIKHKKRSWNITTELWCPPVGGLSSCMWTLSWDLRQCAADTEVIWSAVAATHVLHTGLDVDFSVDEFGAGAPGLWEQHLLTLCLLHGEKKMGGGTKVQNAIRWQVSLIPFSWTIINLQTPCMNPAHSQPHGSHRPLHKGPHSHRSDGELFVSSRTQLDLFGDLHVINPQY